MVKVNVCRWPWGLILLVALALVFVHNAPADAARPIGLVIDGRTIVSDPPPVMQNGRTLVPARIVSEQLGAAVDWFDHDSSVHIIRSNQRVVLRIDSHLMQNDTGRKDYSLSDVAPQLINGRTYVPLRLVSNALGVSIRWDDATHSVFIDSSQQATPTPFFSVKISSITAHDVVTGRTALSISSSRALPVGAAEIRYLLLNPDTARGIVVGRGSDVLATYHWTPGPELDGPRVLVAALYDAQGRFLAGDALPIEVTTSPQVALGGVSPEQVVHGNISLSPVLNFPAAYVTYEITNVSSGRSVVSPKSDPLGTYVWAPMMEDNGQHAIALKAYTANGQEYISETLTVTVDMPRRLELRGFTAGATITRPVNLSVLRNFQVSETEYVLRDPVTGHEESLAIVGFANHRFFPTPAQAGAKELFVRVKDTRGQLHTSSMVPVNISGTPLLLISGVGPNQVVTGPVKLNSTANVPLENVQYFLTNPSTGARTLLGSVLPGAEYTWTPGEAGDWRIHAEASYGGNVLSSDVISLRVYLGTVFGPRPIIARNQFMGLASGLAVQSWQETGMSAALQTAQAILETGWGQSVPVDKYTGLFSNNLFGIKGTGPAGSVISNTWEEYNGVAFRIDDRFRAYNNLDESWADHKRLLLTAARYQPVRDVMHDSTLGAWALRRAGYATDSQYPIKLMDIIRLYELWKLDEVGI